MKISNFFYKIFHKEQHKRIIVLADIHYYHKRNIKKLNKVLDNVKLNRPNYICIPGDLIDQRHIKDSEYLVKWLIKLKNICPVIISLGNHELIKSKKDYSSYDNNLFDEIKKIDNVYFLDNQSKKIDNINFIGLSLPGEYYYYYKENNHKYLIDYINNNIKINDNCYTILLCNTPIELIKNSVFNKLDISSKVDLVICGHMHGGITPNILKKYLKGRGLVSPHRGIFVKHSYGKYEVGKAKFIISSGVTKSSHRNKFSFLDFLLSPEITIIDIDKH